MNKGHIHGRAIYSQKYKAPKRKKYLLGLITVSIFIGVISLTSIANTFSVRATSSSVDTPVTVNVAPSISIAGTSTLSLGNISSGIFSRAGTDISVTTNNPSGYTLSMSMVSTATNNSLNLGSSASIPTISQVLPHGFGNSNGWGYSASNNSSDCTSGECYYHPAPAISNSVNLKSTNTVASSDLTHFDVGVKPSGSQSGTYSNTVTFTATTNNPAPSKTLSSITANTASVKTTGYYSGDNFDPSGLIVTAFYSDSTSRVITDYTIIGGSNLAVGTPTITISYTENGVTKTASFTVTVVAKPASAPAAQSVAPPTSSSSSPSSNTPSGDDTNSNTNAESGNTEVQGVSDSYFSRTKKQDLTLSIVLAASSTCATAAILFLLARRKDDDDDEEEYN